MNDILNVGAITYGHGVATLPPSRHDSPTSQEAGRTMRNVAATLRRQVLKFIVAQGTDGATDDEIQRHLQMPGSTERPRRIELQADGYVEDLGERRATASGRAAVVWHATPKGRAAMAEVP